MQLYMVGASPFARKVRAVGMALGLADRLEIVKSNPHERPPVLVAQNPLSKVPTLVTDEGEAIPDSLMICEYLASLVPGQTVLPLAPGPARRAVMHRHVLANGIMDCGVTRRVESLKASEPDRLATMERQKATIIRVLDWFEAPGRIDGPAEGAMTLDGLTLAAALGYLDFRFPGDGWRDKRSRLTAWYAAAQKRPEISQTRYFDG